MERNKILLIDDDLSQLDLIEVLFENKGYKVYQSISGTNALNKIENKEFAPDVILVDLMMPLMSGAQTIKKLRELGVTVPMIAFTAAEDPELHQEAIDSGANLVLTKPYKPSLLVDEVDRMVSKSKEN